MSNDLTVSKTDISLLKHQMSSFMAGPHGEEEQRGSRCWTVCSPNSRAAVLTPAPPSVAVFGDRSLER